MAEQPADPSQASGRAAWSVDERRGGIGAAVALLVAGVFFVWQASLLDFGRVRLPGPGFFPFVLGAVLVGLSLLIIVDLARRTRSREAVRLGHRDVSIAFAAMAVVPVAFEPLGANLTLGVFIAVLLALIGRVGLLPAVLGAGVGVAAVWYFFEVLLGLRLPNGPF